MMSAIAGKVALVTGGGTGIGAGIAQALAGAGARVVVCGRRRAPLEALSELVRQGCGRITAFPADVSVESQVIELVEAVVAGEGRIDILVNNAAIGGGDEIHRHPVALWDEILAVNLRGPFLLARYVLPYFRAQQAGHMINISSESALNHYEGDGAYGVSKHALNALGEYIQRENQAYGVRVDTICPGMVVSEMTQDTPGLDHERCLQPDDIADLVLWLVTRRENIKIGTPVLIQTMLNPWEG